MTTGFVEETPSLADAARDLTPAICLPFFALRAGHVVDDVPAALAEAGFTGPLLPAIGEHPKAGASDRRCPAPDLPAMTPKPRLRLTFEGGDFLGPGKADLLDHIRSTGSISAAGRAMGMSYKRAWQLVETMNGMFTAPLVESSRGGAQGGGAHLTKPARHVLGHYRDLVTTLTREGADHLSALAALQSRKAPPK